MELLVEVLQWPESISPTTHRPFERHAYRGAWSAHGPGERYACWVVGQLYVFRPPEGWTRSWIHQGSPDMPVLHGHFWRHALGPDSEKVGEERKPNLRRLTQWAENKLRHVERERDTTGLKAALIVSSSPSDGGK